MTEKPREPDVVSREVEQVELISLDGADETFSLPVTRELPAFDLRPSASTLRNVGNRHRIIE